MENKPLSTIPSDDDSIEAIEDEIAKLSALIGAATYRLICLISELDRRDGWADPLASNGFRSCAHWLSWRVGLSLGTARQYVRVAKTLPDLTRISAAFSAGELSYSKVRAITRIAAPENEEMVLGWARAGTASQVEKLVREFRRADPDRENDRALAQQESRSLVTWFDNDGMLVVRGRLSPERGALLVKALEVSADELTADARGSSEPSGATETASASESRLTGDQLKADALARVAERALACDASQAWSSDRFQVVVHVDAEVLADPAADGRCHLEDGPGLAPETVRRLACDATVSVMHHGPDGEQTAGRKTRAISTPLRRALKARDGTRCAFPGCPCRGRDAHHVRAWAEGGPTVLHNLQTLCKAHHTLVHEGSYHIESLPGRRFRFLRPDGRELETAPATGPVAPEPVSALATDWLPPDLSITPDTGRPTWDGEPVDYEWSVLLLSQ
jgi:Domain of unknown function (DUF222)/HNH endonuclease